jgi:beta-N-acetylhexosaminidase
MQWLGNIDDHALTTRVARGLAEELRAMHFDLTWAPCTDVDSNPDNPVIGDRSFSRSPEQCARHALAWLEGMHQSGLAGCVKHFPGHGDTAQDSHLELPSVEKELPDLQHCELVPFQAAIRAGVEAVMTAHVVFPVLDEEWPATLSRRVLHGVLRTELGHSGLVVSDDLEMKAVHGRYSLDVLLDASCRATCDLFLACEDPQLQWQAWEELIHLQESHPAHDTLARDSSQRLLAFRERFFLGRAPEPPLSVVGSHDNLALSKTVRQRGRL